MSQTSKTAPIERDAEPTVSDDLLARIVSETERRVAANANRPSPIRLRSLDELERFADIAARSTAVPKDYQGKPDNCMIAIQMGSELGLAPMQSLQNIAVINGRPAVWGDAMPGLCRASGMMTYMREWSDGEGDTLTWHCETKRRDDPNPILRDFSVMDAKVAKLWGKKGYNGQDTPWITNPGRMLQMRARGFALRDAFPDVLRGLISAEEAADIPFDATGLTAAPSPPPLRAAAAPTPRAPRKVADAQAEDAYSPAETPHDRFMAKLRQAMDDTMTREEAEAVGERDGVKNYLAKATEAQRRDIAAVLANGYGRHVTPATRETPEDLHIEGEHLLAAG